MLDICYLFVFLGVFFRKDNAIFGDLLQKELLSWYLFITSWSSFLNLLVNKERKVFNLKGSYEMPIIQKFYLNCNFYLSYFKCYIYHKLQSFYILCFRYRTMSSQKSYFPTIALRIFRKWNVMLQKHTKFHGIRFLFVKLFVLFLISLRLLPLQ